jgi:hypothetical protein
MARQFITDPETRKVVFSQVSRNSMSWMQEAVKNLPAHAVHLAHASLTHLIADRFNDFVAEAVTDGIVVGATALGGPIGAAAGLAVKYGLKSEIELGVDKVMEATGLTHEHLAESLAGVGDALLEHYHKFRDAAQLVFLGGAPLFGAHPAHEHAHAHDAADVENDQWDAPVLATLELIAEVLREREAPDAGADSEDDLG